MTERFIDVILDALSQDREHVIADQSMAAYAHQHRTIETLFDSGPKRVFRVRRSRSVAPSQAAGSGLIAARLTKISIAQDGGTSAMQVIAASILRPSDQPDLIG